MPPADCRALVHGNLKVPKTSQFKRDTAAYVNGFTEGAQASLECIAAAVSTGAACAEECGSLDTKEDFLTDNVCRQCVLASSMQCNQAALYKCHDCVEEEGANFQGTINRDKLLHKCLSIKTNLSDENYAIIVILSVLGLALMGLTVLYFIRA